MVVNKPPYPKRNLTSLKKDKLSNIETSGQIHMSGGHAQNDIDEQDVDVSQSRFQPVLSNKRTTEKKLVTGAKQTQSQAQIPSNLN